MIAAPLPHVRSMRLELDRMVRARAFIGRAVQGSLTPREYADLIGGVRALADSVGLYEVKAKCAGDLEDLSQEHGAGQLSATLLGRALRGEDVTIASNALLAVTGTSWCTDAADRLSRRQGYATEMLSTLGSLSVVATAQLEATAEEQTEQVLTLCEAARGAFLGVVAWLDYSWRAPVTFVQLGPALT